MKPIRIMIVFFLSTSYIVSIGQYKNNKWIVGVSPLLFDFQKDTTVNSVYTTTPIYYRQAHSNINDSNGVLFSCNGNNIYDRNGDLMENGDEIIPSKVWVGKANQSYQQSIIIPKRSSQYYVFVWGMSDALFDSIKSGLSVWRWNILTYSIVDLKENNGKGKVITKMNYLLEHEDLAASQMSAVRHANGRDWWLVKPHLRKHRFYIYLVTPDVIIPQPIQEFDSPTLANGVIGQSNFAPDGSLYVITSEFYDHFTQVNKFDRCTGLMSKYITIPWVYDSTFTAWSVVGNACFSPNNQFLYLINNVHIVQYDFINNESIELNPSNTSNPNGNDLAYNSSDGRIYIGNFNHTSNSISYIEHPDKKGLAANYCKLCYQTKNNNTASPPNNPNYELGALKGSACDTVGKIQSSSVVIYPNPATSAVNVFVPGPMNTKIKVSLNNVLGQHIYTWEELLNSKQEIELSLNHIAKGMYMMRIETDELNYTGKLLVR